MPPTHATVHIDGAARGNPGPAAYALSLARDGLPDVEESRPMGTATNNVAEYTALVRALEVAAGLGVATLDVFSDSELLVKQMNGEYRVKHPDLQALHREATALRGRFARVTLAHVRRAENKRADFLCNEALDGRPRRADGKGGVRAGGGEGVTEQAGGETSAVVAAPRHALAPSPPHPPSPVPPPPALEEEAVALLNAVRAAWAGGAEGPAAVAVWDRLWAMLGEHRVLR